MEPGPLPNPFPDSGSRAAHGNSDRFLEGNFRPIFVESCLSLRVLEGEIPRDLSGQFMRIGPNPKFDTKGHFYHPFDGDGMVHSVSFSTDKAPTYQNKWVQTLKLKKAIERGFDIFSFGELSAGIFENQHYVADDNGDTMGSANTNIIQHAGKLYALFEADKPYEFNASDLSTVGKADFKNQLKHNVSAHPKVDCRTGDFITFCYNMVGAPEICYSVFDKNLKLKTSLTVELPTPRMMHDMIITQNYSIFFDPQLEFSMEAALEGKSPWVHHTELPARFFVIPRLAKHQSEGRWIDVNPCGLFHFANCWEENEKIYVYGCRSEKMEFVEFEGGPRSKMYEWIIDIKSWSCIMERPLSEHSCDFPQVDQMRQGYKTRYLYAVEFANRPKGSFPAFDAILKYDLQTGEVRRHTGSFIFSETVFAPSLTRSHSDASQEDNGYLVNFAQDERKEQSECYIVDAQTMKVKCRLLVPQRVPYGFHASYIHPSTMLSKL